MEQLSALVRPHVRMHCELSMLAVVSNNELHSLSPAPAEPVLATRDSSTQLFNEVIQRGVDLGVFAPAHAWLAVAAIGGRHPGRQLVYARLRPHHRTGGRHYAGFALGIVRSKAR